MILCFVYSFILDSFFFQVINNEHSFYSLLLVLKMLPVFCFVFEHDLMNSQLNKLISKIYHFPKSYIFSFDIGVSLFS